MCYVSIWWNDGTMRPHLPKVMVAEVAVATCLGVARKMKMTVRGAMRLYAHGSPNDGNIRFSTYETMSIIGTAQDSQSLVSEFSCRNY